MPFFLPDHSVLCLSSSSSAHIEEDADPYVYKGLKFMNIAFRITFYFERRNGCAGKWEQVQEDGC